jgi:hypothetical protein
MFRENRCVFEKVVVLLLKEKAMDGLATCIATGLVGFSNDKDPVDFVKDHILRKTILTNIDLVFKDTANEIVLSATADNGKFFSCCIQTPKAPEQEELLTGYMSELRKQFWEAMQECENFVAGESLQW